MPPLILNEDEVVSGLPFARAKTAAVIEERALIERRLKQADERAAWTTLKGIGAALAA